MCNSGGATLTVLDLSISCLLPKGEVIMKTTSTTVNLQAEGPGSIHGRCSNSQSHRGNRSICHADDNHPHRVRYYRGRVSNLNQSEARKQCFLASYWLKFETLPRKFRTLLKMELIDFGRSWDAYNIID